MSTKNSALKAGILYIIGNFFIKGINFLTIPLFTRLMIPEEYGKFNIFMSYSAFGSLIVSLVIFTSLKNAKYDFPNSYQEYSGNCFILLPIISLILLSLFLIFSFVGVLHISWIYILFLCLECLGQASSSYFCNYLSVDYRAKQYLFVSLFYSFFSVILSVVFIYFHLFNDNSYNRIFGNVIPNFIIFIFVFFYFKKLRNHSFNSSYIKYGLLISLPLLPHAFSQIVLGQFDRMMISKMCSFEAAGIYSFAANISSILMVFAVSMDNAWTPWFFEKMNEKKYFEIKIRSNYYLLFFLILTTGLIFISPELVMLLAGDKYINSKLVCIPLIISVYFNFLYYLPSGVEYFLKKTKFISIGTVTIALLNIFFNYITIKFWGFTAAAYTTAFCYFLYFVFHTFIAIKLIKSNVFLKIFDLIKQIGSIFYILIVLILSIVLMDKIIVRWCCMFILCSFISIYLILLIKKNKNIIYEKGRSINETN